MVGKRVKWQATAQRMFTSAGDAAFDATIRRSSEGQYVPGVGKSPGETSTTCRILFDEGKQWVNTFLANMVVRPGVKVMLIQGPEWPPALGDLIEIAGKDEITIEYVDDIAQLGAVYLALGS